MLHGAALTSTASRGDTTINAIFSAIGVGDSALVNISDDDDLVGEYVTVTKELGGTLRLDRPLEGYYEKEHGGSISIPGQQYDVRDAWLVPAYGDIAHCPQGSDSGCFVQFSVIPDSRNPRRQMKFRHELFDGVDWHSLNPFAVSLNVREDRKSVV